MAKIIDLNKADHLESSATADICIIGAGAAGLFLANRLARHGRSVIILEAGGIFCSTGASVGIESGFSGETYRGATEGRAFGLGGSTSRWGGLLVPHSKLDLRDGMTPQDSVWNHIVEVVCERSNSVFSALSLGARTDFDALVEARYGAEAERFRESGITITSAEFLPFRKRNFTYLASDGGSRQLVYLNAVASSWMCEQNDLERGRVTTVIAKSAYAKRLRVSANSFVLAAGAIESARILLEIDRLAGDRLLPRSAKIGAFLSDHLSCSIAKIHPEDWDATAGLFGPIFSKGRMRSFRFIETSGSSSVPRHFAHFIFENDNPGFWLAKTLLAAVQSRTMRGLTLGQLAAGLGGLSRLAYHRLVDSVLYIPRKTPVHLQLDVEQAPHSDNRVYLSDKVDMFGRASAVVQWRINRLDSENIRLMAERFLKQWPGGRRGIPRLFPIGHDDAQLKPYDAYHPVGTCRMGSDDEAVVDLRLRVRGTSNLFVLSTAVLPSAGTANPTFTMLCLGDKLAGELVN